MRGSAFCFVVSVTIGVWSLCATAQDAADLCNQQGVRPGSAAYNACLSASHDAVHGMYNPLNPEGPVAAVDESSDDEGGSTNSPDDPLIGLNPLGSDGQRADSGLAEWDWALPRR